MKRILFLLQGLPYGGTESALYNLVARLDESKFDVTVYVFYPGGDFYETFCRMCEQKGFRVRKMFHNIKPGRNIFEKIRNHYYLHIVEPQKLQYPKRFYKTAIDGEYDIEVAFTFFGTPKIIAASTNKNSKKVAWIHGDMKSNPWCMKHYKTPLEQHKNYKQFDRVICVSETVKEAFIDTLGDTGNLQVLHNPINTDRVRSLANDDLETNFVDRNTVCAVGRLSHEKGFDRLIKIHKQLLDENVMHKLVIVGDGPERQTLEKLIQQLQLQETVLLTGYDGNPYRYMQKSAFLVCSSYTEGLPVVFQEALSLGKPIVSTHPSAFELFGGKECGIVCDVDDASLKNALGKMLADEPFRKQCEENAQMVGSKIEYADMVRTIEQMLLDL